MRSCSCNGIPRCGAALPCLPSVIRKLTWQRRNLSSPVQQLTRCASLLLISSLSRRCLRVFARCRTEAVGNWHKRMSDVRVRLRHGGIVAGWNAESSVTPGDPFQGAKLRRKKKGRERWAVYTVRGTQKSSEPLQNLLLLMLPRTAAIPLRRLGWDGWHVANEFIGRGTKLHRKKSPTFRLSWVFRSIRQL